MKTKGKNIEIVVKRVDVPEPEQPQPQACKTKPKVLFEQKFEAISKASDNAKTRKQENKK